MVDALAGDAPNLTPYRYAFNNPIRVIDPDGNFEYVKGGYGEDIEVGNTVSSGATVFGSDGKPMVQGGGGGDTDDDGASGSITESLANYFGGLLGDWLSFEVFENIPGFEDKDDIFLGVKNGDHDAQTLLENHMNTANKLSSIPTEVTPYVSISVGKQFSETKISSFYGQLTLTPNNLYGTFGADKSFGPPALGTYTSVSISGGVFVGPESGIPGLGIGGGYGGFVGIEASRSINTEYYVVPTGFGRTMSIGASIGNTPLYVTGNIGGTKKLFTFGK